jgi:ornithine carbamoyltransferase
MFEKASLCTRIRFEGGMNTIGGHAIFIDQPRLTVGERETIDVLAANEPGCWTTKLAPAADLRTDTPPDHG